jgi:uncharacterized protein YecE (DUF72 family)
LSPDPPPIRIGTSSWSSSDWRGPFYPADARPGEFLELYAARYDTVECDATFYRIPSPRTVDGWRSRTPDGFLFAAKLPREITHEAGLVDCQAPVRQFVDVMTRLGDRLGPIVAQFAYVAKGKDPEEYAAGADFRRRLVPFLDAWPKAVELAVEVRNATWIAPPLLDVLRERRVALVLPAIYTLPGPSRLFAGPDPVTTELIYVRFLGHHRKMDERITRLRASGKRSAAWNELAVDRTDEMRQWVAALRERAANGARVLAYFNNHYAGYGPGSADLFRQLWRDG